ncbi:MAG: class I SAM-dependent methyltransferase [Verrucomicrobiota bacterium]|nr:class I SAM-dependent methyltransferase [Verrucomicrobiota bacterium]
MPIEVRQHNVEIQANAAHWRRKPLLRKVYRDFYQDIARGLRRDLAGRTVEIGSGIGNLKSVMPDALATDLFPNPWLDQVENAYALTFPDASVANLILFDVWHHLEYPGTALAEFHRVLAPGGRLVIFDPAMGLLGRVVYGVFHHEPLSLTKPIRWQAPPDFSSREMNYYAAQGNAQRIFFSEEFAAQLAAWRVVQRKQFAGLSYVASGGFRGPQLYPEKMHSAVRAIDRLADSAPNLFATRLLVVLEKK